MNSAGWEFGLHWSFQGEYVLIPSIRLKSFPSFLVASTLTLFICIAERCLSRLLEKHWLPSFLRSSARWQKLAWKTTLYWLAVFMRLNYMLIAMTFHLGLLLVIITSLATTQFTIELLDVPSCRTETGSDRHSDASQRPLVNERPHPLGSMITRPRSRSKPDAIFIHPAESNLARADAVALELGLSDNTDRIHGNRYERASPPWNTGEGREAARKLLGPSHQLSERDPFLVAHDLDSESVLESS